MLDKKLERLVEISAEIRKRNESNRLNSYNKGEKVHKKQLEFHKCNKRNRWVFGGNRSGKTECGAIETIYMARGNHPYRENRKNTIGWVVSLSQQVQRDVAQRKILNYLSPYWINDIIMLSGRKDNPKSGIIDKIEIKNVFGGISEIGFKSCDQGREKFQGTSLDYVWFDEEPPKDIYDECRMRILDKRGDIFGTMTPLKGLTYIHDEIYLNKFNDDNIWYIFMEWGDNPFLNDEEIKEMSKSMSEDMLDSRRYGHFKAQSGLVYPEFDENVNVIEPFDINPEFYDMISIDPGLNNPLSCHWYCVDYDGVVYVVNEHFEAEKDISYHAKKIKEISKSMNWPTDQKGRIRALIDSAANQHTLNSAKSVSELFYDNDILVNSNVNKNMFSGISKVKIFLKPIEGKPKLYIFKNCVNLIRELKSYRWSENDKPIKEDDHALDELRYYIMSRPEAKAKKQFKNEIMRDKEKLIKQLRKRN